MKYNVIIQPPALDDIEVAHQYIYQRAPSRANNWLNKLFEAIESLEEFPGRCPRAPESAEVGQEIRQLLYGKRGGIYRVLFMIIENKVRVLHVRHGARQHLKRGEIDLPPEF